jgi:nicotinate phosphoribosyltransferase
MDKIKQIVSHFTDNDAYTFSVQYYILHTYPRAEVRYSFFDRNNTRYPKGFDKLLQEQINGMKDVVITEEEIAFMKSKIYFLPDWYYNFLRGYRFNPSEVHIFQDLEGYLSIMIEGKWYSTIMWEMPILSTISELMHIVNGDIEKVNYETEYLRAYNKGNVAFRKGILLSDMGTRRRFSFQNQQVVIKALKDVYNDLLNEKEITIPTDKGNKVLKMPKPTGKFVGTSNVWFAKEFGLTPIGTMSHQICSFEECVSGVFECNSQVMKKWSDVYDGDLGIFLPDCFGSKVFLSNFSKKMAKMFDGIRIDSGDERKETEKMIEKYQLLGIDPATKSIVYSNALTIDKAIELHKWLDGRMKDSYGIGTHLCADVTNSEATEKFPYSNIVIKLVGMRITECREWHDCVKLSNDKGKTLGNKEKCEYLIKQIGA